MAEYNMGPYRIRPCGEFNSATRYRYLDLVTYQGGSYVCCNYDTIDGTGVIGVLPTGEDESLLYWQCISVRGDRGPAGEIYKNFEVISDGIWDFHVTNTDKIIIPSEAPDEISIINMHDGQCGIILTEKDLILPSNSDHSIDFDYVTILPSQYYMYSFVYYNNSTRGAIRLNRFIWNRTVIEQWER